jgi:hypothetical protein
VIIKLLSSIAAISLLAGASAASAASVTLTMDEVPNQPINGLSVTKGFETFTFSDPGGGLTYNSLGPGNTTFIQDPSIQGPNEPFSVGFSVPVSFIQFGLAEDSTSPLTGVQVELSSGATFTFDLTLTDPFAEGEFTWSGAPVVGFSLAPAAGPDAIAFDNLTVSTSVPEPSTWAMMLFGFAGLGYMGWRRARNPRLRWRKAVL